MGSAKSTGAGSGAVSGAVAGSAFGPVGTVVGGVAGGLFGYFGSKNQDVPQYQPPPPDPEYLALKQQAEQDKINALEVRSQMTSADLMARYGTRLMMAQSSGAPAIAPPLAAQAPGANSLIPTALNIALGKVA